MATANKPKELVELRNKHVPKAPFNVTTAFIREARGAVMIDVDGRELIDFAGGIGVNNVGHCHPKVVAAIKDQADKYIHTCFHVAMYDTYVSLAEKLNEIAPGDFDKMTMFTKSGAEAVENAARDVGKGQALHTSLAATNIFPHLSIQMIQVGENSGALETMLNKIADVYENEVETTVMSLTALLEPLLIILMGIVIGFIVLSICLPIFEMNQLVL